METTPRPRSETYPRLRMYECLVCFKSFHSKSTLDSHLDSPRHVWHNQKAFKDLSFHGDIKNSTRNQYARREYPLGEVYRPTEELTVNHDTPNIKVTPKNQSETNQPTFKLHKKQSIEEEGYYTDENNNEKIHNKNKEVKRSPKQLKRESTIDENTRHQKMNELKELYKTKDCRRRHRSKELYLTIAETYQALLNPNNNDNSINSSFTLKAKRVLNRLSLETKTESIEEKDKRKKTEEALLKKSMVMNEIIETERDYVNDLGFIVKDFLPLLNSNDVSSSLKQDYHVIFANIGSIYAFHSRIFAEAIIQCEKKTNELKKVFVKHENELKRMYSIYCKSKPTADEAFEIHEEELDTIRKSNFPTRKLNIQDYLVKPVQRLMKYQLLLNSLKKYAENAGEDVTELENIRALFEYDDVKIQEAIDVMERVPKEANDALSIELIQGYEGYLALKDLIYQETFKISIGKGKPSKPIKVFLFENVVVFTERVEREKKLPLYKCIAEGYTAHMGLTDIVENDSLKFAIYFRKYSSSEIFVCQAETLETKETWLQVLKDIIAIQAILQNNVSRHTEKHQKHSQRHSACFYVIENILQQRLKGHPRLYTMSDRLRNSIKTYILDELLELSEDKIHRERTESMTKDKRTRSFNACYVAKTQMNSSDPFHPPKHLLRPMPLRATASSPC